MFPKNILKKELKNLASSIKIYKESFAQCQRNYSNLVEYIQWRYGEKSPHSYFYSSLRCLKSSQARYRYLHIAYSLLRDKEYSSIERYTTKDKKLDINFLNETFKEFCKFNKITDIPYFEVKENSENLDIEIKYSIPDARKNIRNKLDNFWKFFSIKEQI